MQTNEKELALNASSPPVYLDYTARGTTEIPAERNEMLMSPVVEFGAFYEVMDYLDYRALEAISSVSEYKTSCTLENKQDISVPTLYEAQEPPAKEHSCPSYHFDGRSREISLQSISIQTSVDIKPALAPAAPLTDVSSRQQYSTFSDSFEPVSIITANDVLVPSELPRFVSKPTYTSFAQDVTLKMTEEQYTSIVRDVTQRAMQLWSERVVTDDVFDSEEYTPEEKIDDCIDQDECIRCLQDMYEQNNTPHCLYAQPEVCDEYKQCDIADRSMQTRNVIVVQPPRIARMMRSTSVCGFLGVVATGVSGILGLWASK